MSPPTRLLLVGMMGAGKTTVGRMLAQRLGWSYLDSDAQVEQMTGSTVPELFATRGEDAFRAEETRALADAVAGDEPRVISVAGGAVLSAANRALLGSAGTVVWLRADPATLAVRVGDGEGRPLLGVDPAGALAPMDAVRRPLYAQVADIVVDVEGRSPDEVVAAVLKECGLDGDVAR